MEDIICQLLLSIALDKEFVDLLMNKDYKAAYQMLPQYASMAKVESGGRHVAMLLGVIDEDCTPVYYGRRTIFRKLEPSYNIWKNKGFQSKRKYCSGIRKVNSIIKGDSYVPETGT